MYSALLSMFLSSPQKTSRRVFFGKSVLRNSEKKKTDNCSIHFVEQLLGSYDKKRRIRNSSCRFLKNPLCKNKKK